MKIIVYENLKFWSAVRALRLRQKVYYSEATGPVRVLCDVFSLHDQFEKLEWFAGDIKDSVGALQWENIWVDMADILKRYEKEELSLNPFVQSFRPENYNHVAIYLMKSIYNRILFRVYLITFLEVYKRENNIEDIRLIVNDGEVFDYLEEYANKKGVNLQYKWINFSTWLTNFIKVIGYSLIFPLKECFKSLFVRNRYKNSSTDNKVGHWYNFNSVTLDRDRRSALMTLLDAKIPWNKVCLYFENSNVPCTEELRVQMEQLGIEYVSRKRNAAASDKVPVFTASKDFFVILFQENFKLFTNMVKALVSIKPIQLCNLSDFFQFNALYAIHYDFYQQTGIRINFGIEIFHSTDVPKLLALNDLDGIKICCQLSKFNSPNLVTRGVVSDVYFHFGPDGDDILQKSESIYKSKHYCGYISDYAFTNVEARSQKLRQSLVDNGAQFVLSFFDEAFGNSKYHFVSKSEATDVHDALAQMVLDCPGMAVIHKPKRPKLGPDSIKVQQAISTGRYKVITDGQYLNDTYPAEVALASDAVLSTLWGGTTGLECFLVGKPVFYLDLKNLKYYDEYRLSDTSFIFNSLTSLKETIFQFKEGSYQYKVSEELKELYSKQDIYQDGQAIQRVGDYTRWLLESLDQSLGSEMAIAIADQKYKEKWSPSKVQHDLVGEAKIA